MQDEVAALGVQGHIVITTKNIGTLYAVTKTYFTIMVQEKVIATSGTVQGHDGLKVPFVARPLLRPVGLNKMAPVVPVISGAKTIEENDKSINWRKEKYDSSIINLVIVDIKVILGLK